MTRNLRANLVYMAVEAVKSYAGPNASRETAARLLPEWQWLVPLGGEEPGLAAEVLCHFELAEPVMVPGLDYAPEGSEPGHTAGYSRVGAVSWAGNCSCGWAGRVVLDRDAAVLAFRNHLAEVDTAVAA